MVAGLRGARESTHCTGEKKPPRRVISAFESWDLEAKERQTYHSLQWRFYEYRTLVPNSSLCQLAHCLRSSCELVLSIRLDRRRKRTSRYNCGEKMLSMVEPDEVELLISPPTQTPGNRMQGGALSFQTLENKIQLTQLCEKASSNIL